VDGAMMRDFRRELEELDRARGKVHTLADCHAAYTKAERDPGFLDDGDFVLIGFYGGERAVAEARQRQMRATVPAELPSSPVARVKMARPSVTHADHLALADGVARALKPAFEQDRARIAALETQVKTLQDRLLELEAQKVIADVAR
jgi:hypothetical protein